MYVVVFKKCFVKRKYFKYRVEGLSFMRCFFWFWFCNTIFVLFFGRFGGFFKGRFGFWSLENRF